MMKPPVRVWGTTLFVGSVQRRCIVAARTQKEAAALFHIPAIRLRNYGSETGNKEEIAIASCRPRTVLAAIGKIGQHTLGWCVVEFQGNKAKLGAPYVEPCPRCRSTQLCEPGCPVAPWNQQEEQQP